VAAARHGGEMGEAQVEDFAADFQLTHASAPAKRETTGSE